MIARMMRDSGTLYLLLAIYFAVNVALRLVLPNSLELDEGQQLFLAQWLAVGYDTQPPFYNWLQYGVVQVLGDTVLALSLLKNLMLFCCYGLVGAAAHLVIRNKALAIIAVLGMLTIPQIVFESQRDLTHSVAVLFAACLFIYALFGALKSPNVFSYLLTGIAIGIGMISKYNFALLPAAAIIAILFEAEFRGRLINWRMLLTIIAAAAIVTPHAMWFLDNVDVATGRTLGKLTQDASADRASQITGGLFSLAVALIAFGSLTVIAFWISFGRRFHESWAASSPWTRLVGRMFLILIVALILLVVFGGASLIKDRWLTPFFFMLPLYLSLKLDALNQTIGNAPKRFGWIAVLIMIAIPLALFARVPAAQYLGRYAKLNVPYQPAIEGILASRQARPSLIVTSDMQMAGNLRLNAPGIPVMVPGYERFQKNYVFDATHPVLLVWRDKGAEFAEMPEALRRWHASQAEVGRVEPSEQDIAEPYHYGKPGDVYHFSYAWIYPKTGTQ
ncbi:ArnT family glycosyltransferase [Rhizobium sp. LjRoot254]|uniref:ArnT family glycosyltransferase n=1 Tax=Rhizobium sp. LjRoot254 TaxID=3342297 RepID=UPI003ECDB196